MRYCVGSINFSHNPVLRMNARRGVLIVGAIIAGLMIAPGTAPAQSAGASPSQTQSPPPRVSPPALVIAGTAVPAQAAEPNGVFDRIDNAMGAVNGVIGSVLFADLIFWDNTTAPDGSADEGRRLPFIVLWLVVAAVIMTIRMGFINVRGFAHAINITRGRYTSPDAPGDVSHFAALSTALSATVGLGNIAGVAIAVSLGGPGATFWMIVAGLLGMTLKMVECTLAQMYREVRPDGRVLGGPMQYLSKGLAERGIPGIGKGLAVLFAFMCIGGSIGGGNSFQVNQSLNAVQESIPFLAGAPWIYGLVMTVLVGAVILGGIHRIASTADKVVPAMAVVYVVGCLFVILTNTGLIGPAISAIFTQAFRPEAAFGGFIGVLVMGFQRAAFSNVAGAGSAPIAHSAAKTEYPVREGLVALLEPFIDTVVICTMTALVINITGAYNNPEYADIISGAQGAALTSRAFGEQISWFPHVLSLSVFLFAFSTMISWSYYGERSAVWLFGERASKYYKALFLVFTFLGSIITATNVLDFGDLMILGMALPNLIGVYLLSGKVRAALSEYWVKYRLGEFPVYTTKANSVPTSG